MGMYLTTFLDKVAAVTLLSHHFNCRIEYKATVAIPPEKMAALDQVPKLPTNTKVFLIGTSAHCTKSSYEQLIANALLYRAFSSKCKNASARADTSSSIWN